MSEIVLVTGATGFSGRHLCFRLISEGYTVKAFVRRKSQYKDLEARGCKIAFGDLGSGEGIEEAVKGASDIYHIGAAFRIESVPKQYFWDVNVEGTRKLLDASLKYKVRRFIHCSTVGVQGEIKHPPAPEEAPFNPGDHYQESKLEGELLARKYFSSGLPGVVVRPVGIYGPGDTRFLKLFHALSKRRFVMIGSGKALYHLTYIDDLIQGVVLAGKRPEALGEVFTIGGESYTTIGKLINLIADILEKPRPKWRIPFYPIFVASVLCEKICRPMGIEPPIYPRRVEFFHNDRAFDISKAQRLLGFKPQMSLYEGLSQTAEWYRNNGYLLN